jgi:hypothetical protein
MVTANEIISGELGIKRLSTMLPEGSKAVLYDSLAKDTRPRQLIFKNINSLVVLYESTIDGKRQGHFVCLIPRGHSISYFSSLGRSPSDEMDALHITKNAIRRVLGSNFTYNRAKLQKDTYTVNDCGYWVIARAILFDMKLRDFQKLFRPKSIRSSDEMLSIMSLLLANR